MLRSLRRQTYAAASLLLAGLAGAPGCSPKVMAPPEPPEAVRRGDDAFVHEEYEAAIRHYGDYLEVVEHGEYTPRAYYKSAHAAYRLGDYPETIATLDDLERRYPGAHWVQVAALRGDAQREMRHNAEAIVAWDAGMVIASDIDRPKLRQRMGAIVGDLDNVEIVRARREVSSPITVALLDQEVAARQPAELDATAVAVASEAAADRETEAAEAARVGLRPLDDAARDDARPGYGATEYQRGPNRRSGQYKNDNEEGGTAAPDAVAADPAPVAGTYVPAAEATVEVVGEDEVGAEVQAAAMETAPAVAAASADTEAPARLVPVDAATGAAAPVPAPAAPAPAAGNAPAKLVKLDDRLNEAPVAEPNVVVKDTPVVEVADQPAQLQRIEPAGDSTGAESLRAHTQPAAVAAPPPVPAAAAPLDGLEKLDVPDIGEPLP